MGATPQPRHHAHRVGVPIDFQVRNVKRGAEPVSKLRDEIRTVIQKPVKAARDKIREEWGQAKQET